MLIHGSHSKIIKFCYDFMLFYRDTLTFLWFLMKIYANFMAFAEKSAECYPPNDTKSKA